MTEATVSAGEIADEIDRVLTEYMNATNSAIKECEARALREVLWDNKAGIVAALRAQAAAPGEVVTFKRWWIEQTRDQLVAMGKLPPGKLGDWAFLFREMLTDKLSKPGESAAQMIQVLDFLNSIEGAGYGCMAEYGHCTPKEGCGYSEGGK